MVALAKVFSRIRPFRAMVIGDFLLDVYTTGRVKRISPEAPVPVMEVLKQESRPGGAGNVVLNLLALGAEVAAVGRIGSESGSVLKELLNKADVTGLINEPHYQTPIKMRLIAESQQLLRIDTEVISPAAPPIEKEILSQVEALMSKTDVIALSDYGKGGLSAGLIQQVIDRARKANIPVIVDPKGTDFSKYRGATVLKPNLGEAYAAAKLPLQAPLEEVADNLASIAEILLITRSEAGISIFENKERFDFPVRSKEVKDVTGAGDTVLAVLCLGAANGLNIQLAAQLANLAAGLAIEKIGCVQITLSELAARLLEYDTDTKVFDETQSHALHQALRGKSYSVLMLERGQSITISLLKTLQELSKQGTLVVYVQSCGADDEYVHLLSSLPEIDYLILQTKDLHNLHKAIQPQAAFVFSDDRAHPLLPTEEILEVLERYFLLRK